MPFYSAADLKWVRGGVKAQGGLGQGIGQNTHKSKQYSQCKLTSYGMSAIEHSRGRLLVQRSCIGNVNAQMLTLSLAGKVQVCTATHPRRSLRCSINETTYLVPIHMGTYETSLQTKL